MNLGVIRVTLLSALYPCRGYYSAWAIIDARPRLGLEATWVFTHGQVIPERVRVRLGLKR